MSPDDFLRGFASHLGRLLLGCVLVAVSQPFPASGADFQGELKDISPGSHSPRFTWDAYGPAAGRVTKHQGRLQYVTLKLRYRLTTIVGEPLYDYVIGYDFQEGSAITLELPAPPGGAPARELTVYRRSGTTPRVSQKSDTSLVVELPPSGFDLINLYSSRFELSSGAPRFLHITRDEITGQLRPGEWQLDFGATSSPHWSEFYNTNQLARLTRDEAAKANRDKWKKLLAEVGGNRPFGQFGRTLSTNNLMDRVEFSELHLGLGDLERYLTKHLPEVKEFLEPWGRRTGATPEAAAANKGADTSKRAPSSGSDTSAVEAARRNPFASPPTSSGSRNPFSSTARTVPAASASEPGSVRNPFSRTASTDTEAADATNPFARAAERERTGARKQKLAGLRAGGTLVRKQGYLVGTVSRTLEKRLFRGLFLTASSRDERTPEQRAADERWEQSKREAEQRAVKAVEDAFASRGPHIAATRPVPVDYLMRWTKTRDGRDEVVTLPEHAVELAAWLPRNGGDQLLSPVDLPTKQAGNYSFEARQRFDYRLFGSEEEALAYIAGLRGARTANVAPPKLPTLEELLK